MDSEPSIFDQADAEADVRLEAEGLADAKAGRLIPHDEVCAWLETWGTAAETPPPERWFKGPW